MYFKPLILFVMVWCGFLSPLVTHAADKKNDTPAIAIFAGGCFWCMQPPFDALKNKGVISTTVGYSGGNQDQPSYEQVSAGTTGHKEVIQVAFDSAKISYDALLAVFWANIDPYDSKGQFCDKGEQYQSAIYVQNEEQKEMALASKAKLISSGLLKDSIATEILAASQFYPAEEYHQSYYQKNPLRYEFYRYSCGRDKRLEAVWGKSGH